MKLPFFQTKFVIVAVFVFSAFSLPAYAQANQLSLSDILIALRSKKATLPERNKILSEAIATRGTTFMLTPEIEKELAVGGAANDLIESIRHRKALAPTAVAMVEKSENLVSTEENAPPEKRADTAAAAGDLNLALIEYTKTIEADAKPISALTKRSKIYVDKGAYTLAIADFTRLAELEPKNAAALVSRADLYLKKNHPEMAEADYRKVLTLDAANETAKTFVARVDAEKAKELETAKAEAAAAAVAPPVAKSVIVVPEIIDLGTLSEANAIRMIKPIYSQIAVKARIGGKVVVEVELDKEGSVVSTKTISGHPFLKQLSEDAAKKSKFKPAMFQGQPVKGRGQITYNFVEVRQ